jgi:hypothetical protein
VKGRVKQEVFFERALAEYWGSTGGLWALPIFHLRCKTKLFSANIKRSPKV